MTDKEQIDLFSNQVPLSPDFGEPWIASECGAIKNRSGSWLIFNQREIDRIVECVNACKGMRDPAAEIAALKEKKK